ncbi:hypothetical protein IWQ62_003421 [Dispira parvispora]|uniref:Transmembrane protein n=1 Tax=Dispira parvispora TaxID=1520584 RepID=A0A9W8ARU2_9FUNG|nr:hypothetical protein IWQ62_003421 [Dispira parvispora]
MWLSPKRWCGLIFLSISLLGWSIKCQGEIQFIQSSDVIHTASSHDPYLFSQPHFNITGLMMVGNFRPTIRGCELEEPLLSLPSRLDIQNRSDVTKSILFFPYFTSHCDSLSTLVSQVATRWEPAVMKLGYPKPEVIMFAFEAPSGNNEYFGAPFDRNVEISLLDQWPYRYAAFNPNESRKLRKLIQAAQWTQINGNATEIFVSVTQEEGPWNSLLASAPFIVLHWCLTIIGSLACLAVIGWLGYQYKVGFWRVDQRLGLFGIGTTYMIIRIAFPPAKELDMVPDTLVQISFVLGCVVYALFATWWVRVTQPLCALRNCRWLLCCLWFTVANSVVMTLLTLCLRTFFSDQVDVKLIRFSTISLSTVLINVCNVWLSVLTFLAWKRMRFLRIPPQIRKNHRQVTILISVAMSAMSIVCFAQQRMDGFQPISPTWFILVFVSMTIASLILIGATFYATAFYQSLQADSKAFDAGENTDDLSEYSPSTGDTSPRGCSPSLDASIGKGYFSSQHRPLSSHRNLFNSLTWRRFRRKKKSWSVLASNSPPSLSTQPMKGDPNEASAFLTTHQKTGDASPPILTVTPPGALLPVERTRGEMSLGGTISQRLSPLNSGNDWESCPGKVVADTRDSVEGAHSSVTNLLRQQTSSTSLPTSSVLPLRPLKGHRKPRPTSIALRFPEPSARSSLEQGFTSVFTTFPLTPTFSGESTTSRSQRSRDFQRYSLRSNNDRNQH